MFNNWRHLCAVIGSFLMVNGAFLGTIEALGSWHYLATPTGLGALLATEGGWLTSLLTYSLLNQPIGAPKL